MPPRINIPPLTRGLLVLLLTLTLLNASLRFRQSAPLLEHNPDGVAFLTMVPRGSWKYPWVMLTAALIEQNLFSLAASGLTIFFGGRYLERAFGSHEYATFLLFVTMIPNILAFIVYNLWYAVSGNDVRSYVSCDPYPWFHTADSITGPRSFMAHLLWRPHSLSHSNNSSPSIQSDCLRI